MDTTPIRSAPDRPCDVLVVGGGGAGLAAALQLARSRRAVVVVDAGEPRNAPAAHMHGYLGHDGCPPGDFLSQARDEVRGYGVDVVAGTVTSIEPTGVEYGFVATLADGSTVTARRLLVATGLVDELPDVPGVAEQWGRGVVHCPYCHGWEVRDRRIVVLATGPMSGHQALLFRQLSDQVTVVVHEPGVLVDEDRRRLAARHVRIEVTPAEALALDDDALRGVRLRDGRVLDAEAVVVAPRFVARAALLGPLGIGTVEVPMGVGEMVETDARGATSVAGVYAAGNVADASHQVLQAAAEGSRVGAVINADLAHEDAEAASAPEGAMFGDTSTDWDRRYSGAAQVWSGAANPALVAEVARLAPGTALDVGCGEGGDAVWLARRGWDVTAVDISEVALDRARRAALAVDVEVTWSRVDVAADGLGSARYDLVSVQYPALRRTPGDPSVDALLGAVAAGGTLLVVGHAFGEDGHDHGPRGFDPADYVQPADVAARLTAGWTIEVFETRPRPRPADWEGPDVPDVVLRAVRSAGGC